MRSKGILAIGIIGVALYSLLLSGCVSPEKKYGDPSADSSPDVSNTPDTLSMESVKDIIGLLDMTRKVMWAFDNKRDITRFLSDNYAKKINSCRMTEMFGPTKFERTDTLFNGVPQYYDWGNDYVNIEDYKDYDNSYYHYFNTTEIYENSPVTVMSIRDWYIGNYQILRCYFDTKDEGCNPVFAALYDLDMDWMQPYYVTEFKDKSPEQVSEMLSHTPFHQYDMTIRHNFADGIYLAWIDPKYASDGDTLKYIVWMIDCGASYIELLYKEIEPDSLIMVGGDWFNASNMRIDWYL